jgi:hypothetical protein
MIFQLTLTEAVTELILIFISIEFALIIISIILIILLQIYAHIKLKTKVSIRERCTELIKKAILRTNIFTPLKIPRLWRGTWPLLEALEDMNQRLTDPLWIFLKDDLVVRFLKSKAKAKTNSIFWSSRHFAARVFLLSAHSDDPPFLLTLLNDKDFYIRTLAVSAAVKLNSRNVIEQVIHQMTQEPKSCHYPYLNAFKDCDPISLDFVKEICNSAMDSTVTLCCLEILILNQRLVTNLEVGKYKDSDLPEIRRLTAKYLKVSSSSHAREILEHLAQDSDAMVKMEAAKSLGERGGSHSLPILKRMLSDNNWNVRLESARALHKLGEEGISVLRLQDSDLDPLAYDVARHVLTLPNKE